MPRFCGSCGALVTEGAIACGSCSATVLSVGAAAPRASSGLTESLAGALAYVTIVPAIFFLLLEPFNQNRYVRFHAFQSIFLNIIGFVAWLGFTLVVSPLGWAGLLLFSIFYLAGLGLGITLIVEAYRGQRLRLPIIGRLAEKYANNA